LKETYKTPDASTFWRIIDEHKVNAMFTAQRLLEQLKRSENVFAKYDLKKTPLKTQFAVERCVIATN
jgi:propionyl-CoA synthetase